MGGGDGGTQGESRGVVWVEKDLASAEWNSADEVMVTEAIASEAPLYSRV